MPARAGRPAEARARENASTPTVPIAAARMTLGSGRAMTMKTTMTARPTNMRDRRRIGVWTTTAMTAVRRMARLLPLTADRWDMPVASMASLSSSGVRVVSPTTSAGTSARASVGRSSTAPRSRSRTWSETASSPGARGVTSGGPSGVRTARSARPGSAGRSRALKDTRCRHCRPAHRSSPRTRTGVETALRYPRASTVRTRRRTRTRTRSPSAPRTKGSARTRPSTLATDPERASSVTGPARSRHAWVALTTRTRPVTAAVRASSGRRALVASASTTATVPTTRRCPGDHARAQVPLAQATRAGTSARRSAGPAPRCLTTPPGPGRGSARASSPRCRSPLRARRRW